MWLKTKATQTEPSLLLLLLEILKVNSVNKTPLVPTRWLQSISGVTQPQAFVQKFPRPSWGPHWVPHLSHPGLRMIGSPWGPHCVPVHCCSSMSPSIWTLLPCTGIFKCSLLLNSSTIVKGLLPPSVTRSILLLFPFCRKKLHYKHTRVRAS